MNLFGKFTHTFRLFSKTIDFLHLCMYSLYFQQQRTKIIYIEIYTVLLLTKKVAIYAFFVCKIYGPKIWSCKMFDKFQVGVQDRRWIFATTVWGFEGGVGRKWKEDNGTDKETVNGGAVNVQSL